MKRVHLDTSHLLNGFEAFLKETPLDDDSFITDAIDLLSHLVCREKIYCDGAVFDKQRNELRGVLDKLAPSLTSDARRILQEKLNEVIFESGEELPLILEAIKRTSINALRLRNEVPGLNDQLRCCSAIPSSADFTNAINTVLLPHLRDEMSLTEVDAILSDKKIAG